MLDIPIFLVGCVYPEPRDTSRAMDYTIDRARVVCVSVDPAVLVPEVPVAVDALVLGPRCQNLLEVSLCGLRDDVVGAESGLF
ncbi:MAG: hypothetical protein ACI9MC_000822 [Kiritimatiellia bacterium]|jgi:hypothetical protein